MIPKTIHYSWFSGDPYPDHLKACMDTWKKVLPDYEFVLWDAKRLAKCNNVFANEAVSVKNGLLLLILYACMPFIITEAFG